MRARCIIVKAQVVLGALFIQPYVNIKYTTSGVTNC